MSPGFFCNFVAKLGSLMRILIRLAKSWNQISEALTPVCRSSILAYQPNLFNWGDGGGRLAEVM